MGIFSQNLGPTSCNFWANPVTFALESLSADRAQSKRPQRYTHDYSGFSARSDEARRAMAVRPTAGRAPEHDEPRRQLEPHRDREAARAVEDDDERGQRAPPLGDGAVDSETRCVMPQKAQKMRVGPCNPGFPVGNQL